MQIYGCVGRMDVVDVNTFDKKLLDVYNTFKEYGDEPEYVFI
jgi:hypothetical protein